MNSIPPDWDFEIQALREAAGRAGIRGSIDPHEFGIELESAEDLMTRLKTSASPRDELTQRRSRRRRFSLIASSVAAAGVLVTGVLQPWGSSPVQAIIPAVLDFEYAQAEAMAVATGKSPSEAIQQLAEAASRLPAQRANNATQYIVTDSWYADIELKSQTDAEMSNASLVPQISEKWLAADGSLRIVERRDDPLPADGRGLPTSGEWDHQPTTSDETLPAGSLKADLASSLPTVPSALRDELLDNAGCVDRQIGTARSYCLYQEILTLNYEYVASPELMAASWRMLRQEDGFRLMGEVKDRAGRTGIGISLITDDRPEFRNILIADPETGRLLGSEQILITPVDGITIEPPAIMSFTAILESKYID